MKIVGLTGGIGTGKSTVAGMFESLGAVIVDSDALARSYLSRGMNGYEQVLKRYGKGILSNNLEPDRLKIAGIVFKDATERRWLEQLIHPYVFEKIRDEINRWKDKDGIMIIDVPLLFESGADNWLRPVIVVVCSMDAQIKRIQSRTPEISYEHILERIHAQMPIEEKQKKADFIIDNSYGREQTKQQVVNIWRTFMQEKR